MRLPALSELEEKVSPATLQSLLALEPHNKYILSNVNFFIGRFPEGKAFVERLIDQGAPASYFDSARLSAHLNLESRFGSESDVMSRLLTFEKDDGLELRSAQSIKQNDVMERLLTSEKPAEKINALGAHHSAFPGTCSGAWLKRRCHRKSWLAIHFPGA